MDTRLRPYYQSALDLKLPVCYIPEVDCMKIPLGTKNYMFTRSLSPFNNHGSIYLTKNKYATQLILKQAGFPVPQSIAVDLERLQRQGLEDLTRNLRFPLVAKPLRNTFNGEGVQCNIKDNTSLADYLDIHLEHYKAIQIEQFQQGLKEYSVLVFKNRILSILERRPLSIVGDGKHTVDELFMQLKQQKNAESSHLKIDEICLGAQGLTLKNIPKKNQWVRLAYPVNPAQGGTAHPVSLKIPAKNRAYLKKIATQLELDLVGIDIMCEDIYYSFARSYWLVLEANFAPDMSQESAQISKKILKRLILRHPFAYLKHRINTYKTSAPLKAPGGMDG